MSVLGVELRDGVAHAVLVSGLRGGLLSNRIVSWDPAAPEALVANLREHFGTVGKIALSIGLAFLHVKQLKLPPATDSVRRRIVMLEPDRFFAVDDERLAVAITGEIAFAMNAAELERWIAPFEDWAHVESVEPAPVSLARAHSAGTFELAAGSGERGLARIEGGRLISVRRALAQSDLTGGRAVGDFDCALAAVRAPRASMLLSSTLEQRLVRRHAFRTTASAVLGAIALVIALWLVDYSRVRKLAHIEGELAARQARALPALELRAQLSALDRESSAVVEQSRRRTDPLAVLAALSERLPVGAVVLNLQTKGDDWQIDGTARDAAAIVPILDKDPRFRDVRMLSASSRFQESDRTYETFSIAFRVRPTT